MTDNSLVNGSTAKGFDSVRAEFERNFAHRGERGAALAVYHRGELVVDLWGGYRCYKTRQPWKEDTLVLTFSVTKGMAAAALAVAHNRGLFSLDAKVTEYWPEFEHAGKQDVTVRQLITHQAGLVTLDSNHVPQSLHDFDALSDILSRQRPAWKPGTRHGYHTLTLGWYQNELIRRIDPQGRSLGIYFRDEIAKPLSIDFHIGLPDSVSDDRLAVIEGFRRSEVIRNFRDLPFGMVLAGLWPGSLVARSVRNLPMSNPAEIGGERYRHLEIPSANGIGQARAVAKVYSALIGSTPGIPLADATIRAITEPSRVPTLGGRDTILKIDTRYGFGFSRPGSVLRFGTDGASFGAFGAGGAFGMADPRAELGYSYVTNTMGFRLFDEPCELAVRRALYACLEKTS